jgi:hypothetical protein
MFRDLAEVRSGEGRQLGGRLPVPRADIGERQPCNQQVLTWRVLHDFGRNCKLARQRRAGRRGPYPREGYDGKAAGELLMGNALVVHETKADLPKATTTKDFDLKRLR